jgi:serine protease Do
MKKLIVSFGIWLVAAVSYKALAQPTEPSLPKETEDIIIRLKGNKNLDLHIQMKEGNMLVNGKPLVEFNNDSLKIILRKSILADSLFVGINPNNYSLKGHFFVDGNPIKRTFLGVSTETNEEGLEIENIISGGPAEKAGLKEDDVLLTFNGTSLNSPQQLYELVNAQKPGDKAAITYKRNGKKKKLSVVLGEKTEKVASLSFKDDNNKRLIITGRGKLTVPSAPQAPQTPDFPRFDYFNFENDLFDDKNTFGFGFNKKPKQSLGIRIQDTENEMGVKVISVEEASLGMESGLKAEDIITEIQSFKILNTDDARKALNEVKRLNEYKIQVLRNGKPFTVNIKIPRELKTVDL